MSSPSQPQNPVPIIVGAIVGMGSVLAVMFFMMNQPMLGWAAVGLIPVGFALGFLLPNAGLGQPMFKKKSIGDGRGGDKVVRPTR